MTTFTGTIPTIASGDTTTVPTNLATYRDALKAVSEAWTSYTPAWTSTGTAPTIGNGTQVWKYMRVNKLVTFRIQLTFGSTTTYGTGNWIFGLPTAAHADYTANMHLGNGIGLDTSVPAYNQFGALWLSSTTIFCVTFTGTTVGQTVPWTWATGDKVSIGGMYETA